jgi:hypothetical protein
MKVQQPQRLAQHWLGIEAKQQLLTQDTHTRSATTIIAQKNHNPSRTAINITTSPTSNLIPPKHLHAQAAAATAQTKHDMNRKGVWPSRDNQTRSTCTTTSFISNTNKIGHQSTQVKALSEPAALAPAPVSSLPTLSPTQHIPVTARLHTAQAASSVVLS